MCEMHSGCTAWHDAVRCAQVSAVAGGGDLEISLTALTGDPDAFVCLPEGNPYGRCTQKT